MCGIFGAISKQQVAPMILEGLKRLEYRGYDSAGIGTIINGSIELRRSVGKLSQLDDLLSEKPISGNIGIGHTRWATHGSVTVENAHPHATEKVAVVHNGIIENYKILKDQLEAKGYKFKSQTDTEAVAVMITDYLYRGITPTEAVRRTVAKIEGSFALAIIFTSNENLIVGTRRNSPLVVGIGKDDVYLSSDAIALGPFAKEIIYLEENDLLELKLEGVTIRNASGEVAHRDRLENTFLGQLGQKSGYQHFMEKEIFEQPTVIGETLGVYINPTLQTIRMPPLPFKISQVPKISIAATGSGLNAGLIAKYWIERLAEIPVEVHIASELRYRQPPLPNEGMALFISQSGETADTLAALRYCREKNQHIVSILNVPDSSIARESDIVIPTFAGQEVGVASTKSYICQLAVLLSIAIFLGRSRGTISHKQESKICSSLSVISHKISQILELNDICKTTARQLSNYESAIYLGRGIMYPVANEGALKMVEIAYVHASAYAAGEFKHGWLTLIDENMPVIFLAPSVDLFSKSASSVIEILSRRAKVIFISDKAGLEQIDQDFFASIEMPAVDEILTPIIYSIPLQLLAYHAGVFRARDVDQPRNLAKSVTVE